MAPEALEDLTVTRLRAIAREKGLHGYSDKSKDELLDLLEDEDVTQDDIDATAAGAGAESDDVDLAALPLSSATDAPIAQRLAASSEVELPELDPTTRLYVEPRLSGPRAVGAEYPDRSGDEE